MIISHSSRYILKLHLGWKFVTIYTFMNIIAQKIAPTLFTFALGYFLKRKQLFSPADGKSLLKLVFYTTGPLLTLRSLSVVKMDASLLVFPLSTIALVIASFLVAISLKNSLGLNKKQKGVFMSSSMLINSAFALPFIISAIGDPGVARTSLFGITNNLLIYGWVYLIAVKYGQDQTAEEKMSVINQVLKTPGLWAVTLGLLMNFLNTAIPQFILPFVNSIANMTGPLIFLSLGFIFNFKVIHLRASLIALFSRIGVGIIIGLAIVNFFGLQGIDKLTMMLLAASPVGINTVIFASLENLDEEFAASIVSIGLVVGLILMPILITVLS